MGWDRHARVGASLLRHLDAAHNLARWLVRDACAAEDVVQEAVLRACRYFPLIRNGNEKVWLLRTVRNIAYDYVGCERRRSGEIWRNAALADASTGIDCSDRSAEPVLMQRQKPAPLVEAIVALPMPLRECVVLREVEALSYKQIAEITNVPVGAVTFMLSRARHVLLATQLS